MRLTCLMKAGSSNPIVAATNASATALFNMARPRTDRNYNRPSARVAVPALRLTLQCTGPGLALLAPAGYRGRYLFERIIQQKRDSYG